MAVQSINNSGRHGKTRTSSNLEFQRRGQDAAGIIKNEWANTIALFITAMSLHLKSDEGQIDQSKHV